MILFSVYIYIIYENNREKTFYDRLQHKIQSTIEIYDKHDTLSEKVITSIPEQSEYVFNHNKEKIFFINPINDFNFDNAFFQNLDTKEEYRFHYKTAADQHEKDGLAITFFNEGVKKYAVITAYNQNGFEMLYSLKSILIYGNVILIFLIAISGYLLSYVALKPLNKLVHEIEAINPNNLNVKLIERKSNDEVAIVASSFNGLLAKINALVETQRSFISYASHELRTPLAAISGILETSVKYDKDVENIKNSSEQAYKELSKVIVLTNELLQLSKIESIDSQIKFIPVNILELVIDVINSYKNRNKNQEFDLFISDGYAIESNDIVIFGNEDLLKTAISNIIDNAIKYSDEKKIFVRMEMNTSEEIKMSIIDKGIGIESTDIDVIYNPMTRGINSGAKEGYGLGLTLTKKIIDIHKGRIEIKSKPQHGTEVSIFLLTHNPL
ncbi:MAG TPA: HAMP domain-containing sensor histidine kinase [Bacteroidia bacterium]|nr:HAMP domain-containing sensor histidine kinase [Bacteroidia bacterium]